VIRAREGAREKEAQLVAPLFLLPALAIYVVFLVVPAIAALAR